MKKFFGDKKFIDDFSQGSFNGMIRPETIQGRLRTEWNRAVGYKNQKFSVKVNTSDKRKLKFVIYKKAMYTNSSERETQRYNEANMEALEALSSEDTLKQTEY